MGVSGGVRHASIVSYVHDYVRHPTPGLRNATSFLTILSEALGFHAEKVSLALACIIALR